MIDEKKLMEELMPLLNEHGNMYFAGRIVGLIDGEPKIGEWIPCSEQLPEEHKEVLVWYEYFRYGDYNKMFQTYGIGYQADGFWGGDVSGKRSKCIAWQPLPEPYI